MSKEGLHQHLLLNESLDQTQCTTVCLHLQPPRRMHGRRKRPRLHEDHLMWELCLLISLLFSQSRRYHHLVHNSRENVHAPSTTHNTMSNTIRHHAYLQQHLLMEEDLVILSCYHILTQTTRVSPTITSRPTPSLGAVVRT